MWGKTITIILLPWRHVTVVGVDHQSRVCLLFAHAAFWYSYPARLSFSRQSALISALETFALPFSSIKGVVALKESIERT